MSPTSILRHPSGARGRSSLRKRLLLATVLAGCGLPAEAAQYPVVPTPAQDPLVTNLNIPADAPTRGMWSGVIPWSLIALHTALMPNGLVATYGSPTGNASQDGRTFDLWDPLRIYQNNPVHTTVPGVASIDSFCSTSAMLPTGNLLVSGGIVSPSGGTNDHGSVLLNTTGTTVTQAAATLAQDRYYSTMVTLPSGLPLIMGGNIPYSTGYNDPNGYISSGYMGSMTPEIYDPTAGWRSLFGANSRTAFGPDFSRYWYPRAWVAPNGKVFGISSEQMWSLDPTGNGSVTSLGTFKTSMNFGSGIAATAAPNVGPTSTAVMYDVGKILQVGGNGRYNGDATVSSSLATTVDITGNQPVVRDVAPMSYGRQWASATVLPTGKVAVTGGSTYADNAGSNAVLAVETWDPASAAWSVGASGAVYRGYHSTATLLQDGAVLVAGGGIPGPVNNLNAEIYYPPYLFKAVNGQATLASRPQIVSLGTAQLAHAQSFGVEVNAPAGVAKVAFLRLGAVTHSFDTGQRYVPASFTQAGNLLTVAAPASPNTAPPGYYQLVVVDGSGVPSAGVIVALGTGVAAPLATNVPATIASALAGTGWSNCAAEGGSCTAAGTQAVAFGAGNQWITKSVTGTIACTAGAFGGDPIFGTVKSCQIQAGQVAANGGGAAGSGTGTTSGGSTTGSGGSGTPSGAGGAGSSQPTSTVSLPVDGVVRSLASVAQPGYVVRHGNFVGWLNQISPTSDTLSKDDSSFYTRPGLAGAQCYSFESKNYPGYFLRHQNFQIKLTSNDKSASFANDATFCAVQGLSGSGFSLKAINYPNNYMRSRGDQMWLDQNDGSTGFAQTATFALSAQYLPIDGRLHALASLGGGGLVRHQYFQGLVSPITSSSSAADRSDASFYVRAGNANAGCYSFEASNYPGYFLRHSNFTLYLNKNDGSPLFQNDSTFCLQQGLAGSGDSLTALNYPTYYLRQAAGTLVIKPNDGSAQMSKDATFAVVPAP